MAKTGEPERWLDQAIVVAQALEDLVNRAADRKRITFVGYGFLIRQRRLAQAISALGTESAYEGRMLLRSMIEIHINYAWMRLRSPDRRANRFLRFESLDRMKQLSELQAVLSEEEYAAAEKRLRRQRNRTAHLFRRRNSDNKFVWASNFAGRALDARLVEVIKVEKPGEWDRFLYGIYRWVSSAVHGGSMSLGEVMERTGIGLRAKAQPEADPTAQMVSACLILVGTVQDLAKDLSVLDDIQHRLVGVTAYLKSFRAPDPSAA